MKKNINLFLSPHTKCTFHKRTDDDKIQREIQAKQSIFYIS